MLTTRGACAAPVCLLAPCFARCGGRIQSQEDRGGTQIVNARVPLSEMFGYATDLRSRTQGRATYSMHFDRYEQAPPDVSGEVVARIQGAPTK